MADARDPLRYFRIEARELIDQISAAVLDLDQEPGPDLVARLLRYAHTLKGAARVVKQTDIADRAHEFEDVLVPHRGSAPVQMPPDEMRELLRLNDEISRFVGQLEKPAETAEPAPDPHEDDEPAPRAAGADLDDLLDAIGEASARIAPLRDGSRTLSGLQRRIEAFSDRLRVARPGGDAGTRASSQRLAAEMGALGRRLTDAVDQVERELDEVRGRAEGLRLVSAGTIFTALHRAVHDAADAEGKRIRFTAHGADTRLGPSVLNQVNGAFLHVVRNAVVHGIEPAAQRAAAGKPAEGSVTVDVERRGRWVYFRCTDDGRGFDLTALRRVAVARGLLPEGREPGEQELIDLVLHGGISTSGAVTEVAGRGIGMDVARDVAVQLGGTVDIKNRPGRGATVEISLPLTLLSMNGLIVEAGGTIATMPLDAVQRCVRLPAADAVTAAAGGRFPHEGQAVPFLPLARTMSPAAPEPTGSGVAIVLRADDDTVAVGVDRLAGTTTLVARPLPDLAPASAVIGGVAMDMDGNPRLVLDAHGLVAEAFRDVRVAGAPPDASRPRMPILVVDDSLTTRMLERSILESAGYEVDLAASAEEGLDRAHKRDYGLFLTDIDMPGMDGFGFVATTRADPALGHIPAILVSSRASAEDRRRGEEAGASAYVIKGEFNQEELLAHIRRLIL
jgi:two-component system chemotaxis sensor kinase CheA